MNTDFELPKKVGEELAEIFTDACMGQVVEACQRYREESSIEPSGFVEGTTPDKDDIPLSSEINKFEYEYDVPMTPNRRCTL